MANAIHVDIDNALTDSPPWDQPIPDALREEIASIIAMQVDCTPIFDQITDIACKLLRERGWDAKETWISSALLQRRYGAWGNHEDYPRPDWQKEVNNGDTSLGYWDWVVQQIDLVAEEEKA